MDMNSNNYSYVLAVCLALLLGTTFNLNAQSMYQVDPFAAAASPFTALDSTELTTELLAERGGPFFSLYDYSHNSPHHDSLTFDVDGLQMAGVTALSMAYDGTDMTWMDEDWYKDRQRDVSDTLFSNYAVMGYGLDLDGKSSLNELKFKSDTLRPPSYSILYDDQNSRILSATLDSVRLYGWYNTEDSLIIRNIRMDVTYGSTP